MKSIYLYTLVLLLTVSCNTTTSQNTQNKAPKYIFLFIGDGMGMVQSQAADLYLRTNEQDSLDLLYLPGTGYMSTHSANSQITGSAASGTAISTGTKTNNGMLGISPTGDTLFSFMNTAHKKGMKTGIISSVSLDHATPAAFYAHRNSRNNYHEISVQLAHSDIDFFAGGGFLNPVNKFQNAYTLAEKNGYTLIKSPENLSSLQPDSRYIIYDSLTALPYAIDSQKNRFSLEMITQAAIENLKNEQGFVIMIEGGKIDWASHANDAATTIHEVIEFNKAITKALKFYNKHPEETLIIVTADHETGGMALGEAVVPYETHYDMLVHQLISYEKFEDTLRKIWQDNPKISFEEVYAHITQFYSIGDNYINFSKDDILCIRRAYDFINNNYKISEKEALLKYNCTNISALALDKLSAITITTNRIVAQKSGIGWTTYAHSSAHVPVFTIGIGKEPFCGLIDNTDISKIITSYIDQE
ncbi:MAG: alkaline phosphatase [Bacteroidales bacterium]|jgi:alkaline phosphatase|nr:alkaline phosphatase [Bacteroidales bacterium]